MALDLTKPAANSKGASSELRTNFSSLASALGGVSIVRDGGFKVWGAGLTSAPSYYTTTGTAPTIAQAAEITGTLDASTSTTNAYETGIESYAKIGDTFRNTTRSATRVITAVNTNYVTMAAVTSQASGDTFYMLPYPAGDNGLKLTRGAASGGIKQIILNTTDARAWLRRFRGGYVSFGCWIHALVGSNARLAAYDGVTTTYSSYHTSTVGWEWLSFTHAFDDDWNQLEIHCLVDAASSAAVFAGLTGLVGDAAPQNYVPCIVQPGSIEFNYPATVAADSDTPNKYQRKTFSRPTYITGASAVLHACTTAGGAVTVDLYKQGSGESPSYSTCFSSAMSVAQSAYVPSSLPSFSAYDKRCFDGGIGKATPTNAYSTIACKVASAGTGGTDLRVIVMTQQFIGALEHALGCGSTGAA